MRILIIRHAEPNYAIDGLTEKGQREAELLAEKMRGEDIDKIYVSPLGRARLTAKPIEAVKNMSAEVCEWLREFDYATVKLPYLNEPACCWDLLPEFVGEHPELYLPDRWTKVDFIAESKVPDSYRAACTEFDELLKKHGYVRDGINYRAENPNHETIALVCHYGVSSVLLSHLLNCSPYSIWQNCVTLPSSVTTLYTEERRCGTASFRMCGMGDVSHLYQGGEAASFAARFCECFTDGTRH